MLATEAYRAGFMLKCAALGLSHEFAQVLYAEPNVSKSGVLGALAGHGFNVGRGMLNGVDRAVAGAGTLGTGLADGSLIPKSDKKTPASLSDDVLKNILMAAHYQKARQALLGASGRAA